MLPAHFYRPENLHKVRYAYIAALVLIALLCGYVGLCTAADFRNLGEARDELAASRARLAQLADDAKRADELELDSGSLANGGVEQLAVMVSEWARARGIRIEALSPEGAPVETEPKVGDKSLGKWKSEKVRVQGQGEFEQVMNLLDRFADSRVPVQIQSFTVQSNGDGTEGRVSFRLALIVYEKAGEAK